MVQNRENEIREGETVDFDVHKSSRFNPLNTQENFQDMNKSTNVIDNRHSGESQESELTNQGKKAVMNEAIIRKKLKKMCYRPRRKVINFF